MQIGRAVGWAGLVAHLALGFWYAATPLVAPAWGVAGLVLIWLVLLAVAIRLLRRRPVLVPVVPVAAVLIWVAAVSAGDAWLGWTA